MGKFWNQILAEIKAFSRLSDDFREETEQTKRAVSKLSREYPPWDELEPEADSQEISYEPIQEDWGGATIKY